MTLLRNTATRSSDFSYVDRRVRVSACYDGVTRGGSAHEQMSLLGTPEHDGEDRSFCCYLEIDLSALANTQGPGTCPGYPDRAVAIRTNSVRFDIVLELSLHPTILLGLP